MNINKMFKINKFKLIAKILFLVFFIISLIYILAIIILIYIGPLETRTVQKNIKKSSARIVVSLNATEKSINNIQKTLDAIIRQSIRADRIYINLNKKNIIPDWLKQLANNHSNIIINITKDYGKLTKILGILEQETDPNTIIVTLDNDRFYPKHAIRDLIKNYLPDTYKINYKLNSVITGTGLNILFGPKFEANYYFIQMSDRPSLSVVSASGVVYKRNFFNKDIFSFMENIPTSCQASDDLMVSVYLMMHSVSIVKVSGISYNEAMKNILTTKVNWDNYYKDYGDCLASFPKYNKKLEQEKFLYRTKVLYSLFGWEISRNYFYQKIYIYLEKFIKHMPFLADLIIWVMK